MNLSFKKIILSNLFSLALLTGYAQIEFCATPVEENDMIRLEVRTNNFTQISSMQFGVAWSINKFDFVEITDINTDLDEYDENKFSPIFDNVPEQISLIRTLWFDPALSGTDLEDGSLLFTVVLDPITDTVSTNYGIVPDSQFPIEVANADLIELDVVLDNCDGIGTFNISTSTTNQVEPKFTVTPNPFADYLQISHLKSDSGFYEIYDLNGKQVMSNRFDQRDQLHIDLSNLSTGQYLISFIGQNLEDLGTKLIIKE